MTKCWTGQSSNHTKEKGIVKTKKHVHMYDHGGSFLHQYVTHAVKRRQREQY